MPDVGGGSGAYPELRATGLDAFEATGKEFAAAAPDYAARSRTYRQTAFELESTNSGATINEMVFVHHVRARKHEDRADAQQELAKASKKVVELGHRMNSCLDQIHHETQQEADAADVLPGVRASIIAAGYARAVAAHNDFAAAVERVHRQAAANTSQSLTFILGRDIPKDQRDSTQALDNKIATRSDPKPDEKPQKATDASNTSDRGDPATTGTPQNGPTRTVATRGDGSGSNSEAAATPDTASRGDGEMPAVIQAMSPRPSVGAPPLSGGGSPGGMPGSGLLGGGNPLSSLTSGLGQSGATPGGLGGLANGAAMPSAAQAAQIGQSPGAAIAKSIAAGAGGGGGGAPVAPVSPPTTTGVSSAGGAAPMPSAGASGIAPSSGLGASGAHVAPAAAAPVSSSVGGGSAAPAMMVPPPGMGAPAAPVSAGSGGAPVVPAANTGNSSSGAGSSGSGVVPGSGATAVVPAAVVSAAAGNSGRSESPALTTARKLAARLRRDSDAVECRVIEWAVGVFRPVDGSAPSETVIVSNEGWGYVPQGVFVPRGVRLLSTDPLVQFGFEKRWTGWLDPARVLVEYAALRQERGGGTLVAAAATNRVEPFRTAGVEHALCPRESGLGLSQRALDASNMDRFEATYPDLSARVERLCSADRAAMLADVVRPLAVLMMNDMASGSSPYPPELRDMADRVFSGGAVSTEAWQDFAKAYNGQYANTVVASPGFKDVAPEDDPTDRSKYGELWLITRTMEVVRGFLYRPEPVADMLYAMASGQPDDFSQRVSPLLRELEMRL